MKIKAIKTFILLLSIGILSANSLANDTSLTGSFKGYQKGCDGGSEASCKKVKKIQSEISSFLFW